MEAYYRQQQALRRSVSSYPLTTIPGEAFQRIVTLIELFPDPDLSVWVEVVQAYRAQATAKHSHLHHLASPETNSTAYTPASTCASFSKTENIPCACPNCWQGFSRAFEMKRHLLSCKDLASWQCPDCSQSFTRQDHFSKHHRTDHSCHPEKCEHGTQAKRLIRERTVAACGFCDNGQLFSITSLPELDTFLQHIVDHYKNGATRADWDVTREIISLLSRTDTMPLWHKLGCGRFGMSPDNVVPPWSKMTWTADDENVKRAISFLGRPPSSQHALRACLDGLLVAGADTVPHVRARPEFDAGVAGQHNCPFLPSGIIEDAINEPWSKAMLTGFDDNTALASPMSVDPSATRDAMPYLSDGTALYDPSLDEGSVTSGRIDGVKGSLDVGDGWVGANAQLSDSGYTSAPPAVSSTKNPCLPFGIEPVAHGRNAASSSHSNCPQSIADLAADGISLDGIKYEFDFDPLSETGQGQGMLLDSPPTASALASAYPLDFGPSISATIPAASQDADDHVPAHTAMQQHDGLDLMTSHSLPTNNGATFAPPLTINAPPAAPKGHKRSRSSQVIDKTWARIMRRGS